MSCGSDSQSRVSKTQQNVRAQKIVLIALGVFFLSGVRSVVHDWLRLDEPRADQNPHPLGVFGVLLVGSGSGRFSPTRGFIVLLLGSCSGRFSATSSSGGGGSPLLLGSGTGRFSPTPSLGVFSALLLGPVRACSVRSPLLGLFCVLLLGSDSAWLSQTPSAGGGGGGVGWSRVRFGAAWSDPWGLVSCFVARVRLWSAQGDLPPWGCLIVMHCWGPVRTAAVRPLPAESV